MHFPIEEDESEIRYGWIWGTTISDFQDKIVKRVAWAEGGVTVTVWVLPQENRDKQRRPYKLMETLQFSNSEYFAWLPNLENWNGVE